jgi:hypothetical protein
MQVRTQWLLGGAIAIALVVGSILATSVSAQTAPTRGGPGSAGCPGLAMMGAGFEPGMSVRSGTMHDTIAGALGMTSQELWEAYAAGKSVASLAQEKNVDLAQVVGAALAAHSARLDAAVEAGPLTQAQADVMTAFMRSRIEAAFQDSVAVGTRGFGPGMMGIRGMMGSRGTMRPGFGPPPQGTP